MSFSTTHARLERLSRLAAITGGLGIIFISVMVTIDVFLRKFFGTTVGGASEISGMIFAVATAMAYPYTLLDRANIRIDVVYTRLSLKVRAILDLIAMLAVFYFASRLIISAFDLLEKSWSSGKKSVGVVNIPMWIPQSLWFFGFALFALTAAFLSLYVLVSIIRGDYSTATRVAGVPSIEEAIEEETFADVPAGPHRSGRSDDGEKS